MRRTVLSLDKLQSKWNGTSSSPLTEWTHNGKSFSKRASSEMNTKIYNEHRMMRIERKKMQLEKKKIRLIASPLGNAIIITMQRRIKTATTTKCRVKSVFILPTNHINNALFILHLFFHFSCHFHTIANLHGSYWKKGGKNRSNVGKNSETILNKQKNLQKKSEIMLIT